MTSSRLLRVLRGRRPVASAAVACGTAALGCLEALLLLPWREGRAALPRQDRVAEAAAERGAPGPHGQTTPATQLAAGVAHNFNNILQAIIGSLDLLMDEVAADAPARKLAGIGLDAAMRGSRLTHHLLSYAGNQMLRPEPIAVADFLSGMKIPLSRTLGPHIAIDLLVRGTPAVFADPGDLQTALRNIAINAAQAMPGGGTLRIEAREESGDGAAWVGIAVADTGAGMDAATLARATEPFFTTKGGAGAGLGLSMAKGFAEQSGGTLRIVSAPGCGTLVTLRLPATASAHRLLVMNDAGVHRPVRQYA